MIDQYTKFSSCGLSTEYIGSAQTNMANKKWVLDGEAQLVFATPEATIQHTGTC